MSTLIFDSTQGGSISLIGANTNNFYTLSVPAVNGTFLTQDLNGQTLINANTGYIPLTLQINGSTFLTSDINGNLLSSTNIISSSTGYWTVPNGTTVQRPSSPATGMFRYNNTLGIFEGYTVTGWGPISGGGGASANGVIYQNYTQIANNYSISTGTNGFSVGPITILAGVTVTVPNNQRWVIL